MRLHGRLDRLNFDSRLLGDNPLGDPSRRDVYVYTPPGYEDDSRRYPSVMLLAGYGGTHHSLVAFDPFSPNVVERFDRLVAAGQCQPALLVLPDAIDRWGGSQFIDSTATGRYQQYLADEVVPFVDARYRTIPERSGRAIAGRSSGGFGALRMGLDRPEVFAAIGSHAGDCAFELSILPELREAAIAYDRAGGVAAFIEAFTRDPGRNSFTAMMIIAYAAAYAPEPDAPPPQAALPFDPRTGLLVPEVWGRWLAHDPLQRVLQDDSAFSGTSLLFIDAGNRDEHGLHFGGRLLVDALSGRNLPLRYEEFDGGHRGTGHRYDVSLPALVAACG